MKCEQCGYANILFEFSNGKISCSLCGYLIEEGLLNPIISFNQNGSGKTSSGGCIVANKTRILTNSRQNSNLIILGAKRKINQITSSLKLDIRIQDSAFRLFSLASSKGYIQPRKIQALCISCIYIICRREKTSHLLIDFSDMIQTRFSKIGTIFLRFIRDLNISLPIIDPSLFVYRFAICLHLGSKTNSIARSALRLIARMKRDWITTGRRPSGLCGAALLLSTRMHGIQKSPKEIIEIVRVGSVVLRSRLREITHSSISSLTLFEIDRGGGDNGDRTSLIDNFKSNNITPPSKAKREFKRLSPFEKSVTSKKKVGNKKFNTKYRSKKLSCELKEDISMYINTNLEANIKKDVWKENNYSFTCSQSILARAQKEKPFAFFKINKKFRINFNK